MLHSSADDRPTEMMGDHIWTRAANTPVGTVTFALPRWRSEGKIIGTVQNFLLHRVHHMILQHGVLLSVDCWLLDIRPLLCLVAEKRKYLVSEHFFTVPNLIHYK